MKEHVTCDRCGAVYEIESYINLGMRDKDSNDCDFCNSSVISWDSSSIPNLRLVQRPLGR